MGIGRRPQSCPDWCLGSGVQGAYAHNHERTHTHAHTHCLLDTHSDTLDMWDLRKSWDTSNSVMSEFWYILNELMHRPVTIVEP